MDHFAEARPPAFPIGKSGSFALRNDFDKFDRKSYTLNACAAGQRWSADSDLGKKMCSTVREGGPNVEASGAKKGAWPC